METKGMHEGHRTDKHIRWLSMGCAVLALTAGTTTMPASAQDAESGFELEEITVTARRYAERLQDAPVAVNVMMGDYLLTQRVETIDDVIQLTPGATFIRFNKIQPEYQIRGINGNAEGTSQEAPVVTVIDNVVISKDLLKNPAMFDMERVEVLRGPQGTSFGRNASAGLVHLITKRPTTEFEAGLNAGAGSHELFEADGYVSGPLTDKLAARLAFNFDTYDGYIEDAITGRGLDGQENTAVRGSLLFEPTDGLSIYFKAEYNEDNDEGPVRRSRDCSFPQIIAGNDAGNRAVFAPPGPPLPNFPVTFFDPCDEFKTEISEGFDFHVDREMINLTAEIAWEVAEGYTVTSVTGYIDGETDRLQDAQGTPANILFQAGNQDAEIFTQEVRIDNHGTGNRLRWLGGVFYLTDDHSRFDENRFFVDGLPSPPGQPAGSFGGRVETRDTRVSDNETDSIGIFGELTFDVTDRLNVTAGVRWARDEKDGTVGHFGFGDGGPIGSIQAPGQPVGVTCADIFDPPFMRVCGDANNKAGFGDPFAVSPDRIAVDDDWDDVMVKASVQYQVAERHMVYFLFSQGYKAGGFQPEPPNQAVGLISFDKETSDNFEIGWKGEFAGRARFALTGFFLDYTDLQLSQFVAIPGEEFPPQVIGNADAQSYGIEGEGTFFITPDFRISGTFAVQDVELRDNIDTDGDGIPDPTKGFRPDNASKWTATANAEYDFHLPGGSTLTLRGDYRGRSNAWDDIINRDLLTASGESPRRLRPSADIFGARLTWESASGNLSVSLWGENLFEEEEILNIAPPQPNTIQNPVAFGAPRRYGATASFRF